MRVIIHKRIEDDLAVLVDWRRLEPYWQRDCTPQPNRSELIDKYSQHWINRWNGLNYFTIPEIGWNDKYKSVAFSNGRNRTALITKFQYMIPVAICDKDLSHEEISAAIISNLNEGDYVDIPDLEFLTENDWKKIRMRN